MSVRPHILLANVFFAPFSYGGATVVAEQVARNLSARGVARISAVSLVSRPELTAYAVIRSQVAGIDNYLVNVPAGRPYALHYDNPEVGRVVDGLIADLAPDVMHAHCIQEMGGDMLRAAHRAGVPLILSVHDYWWICERQFMLRPDHVYCAQNPVRIMDCRGCVANHADATRRFETLQDVAALADVVTYPSRFARDLCEASGLAPGRGVIWENGVHLPGADFALRQAERRARDPRPVFGFVGGPSSTKGWPLIREAFHGIRRDGFAVHLVEGSLDGSWWRGHDFSNLPGEWRVVPRYDQARMDAFYAGIDVLLFMSQWKETFGLTIREALARGISVIQTDSGGTTEHAAADPALLIPIGSGPEVLRARLVAALDAHPAAAAPVVTVAGFDDQARAFERILATLPGLRATKSRTTSENG
jgi:glycosyltransferase involved in cell wall biosynthesis